MSEFDSGRMAIHATTKEAVLHVADQEYQSLRGVGLPLVRNNHEAYGIMADLYSKVQGHFSGLKKEMSSALGLLPESSELFYDVCGKVYDDALGVAIAAVHMAIHMQNIVTQNAPYVGQTADATPLENLAAELGELDLTETDEESEEA